MEPLIVSGTLDELGTIAKYILAVAGAAGLEKTASYDLRLAVDEIVTNIIIHGYGEAHRTGDIKIQAELSEQTLEIAIEDTGIPYDPTQAPPPSDLHLPLERRQAGGLGVYLALQGVERLTYERAGDRNRNILVVNRQGYCQHPRTKDEKPMTHD
ncbi:MAG: ATP-binding protein [Cyanobacteriota bacterium]|nr:ATP-binding protein [Cyanobacteriota bacterium]